MSQAAYEHNGVPVTAERFYAIACDPARSVAVEACAGAGKTWMLVSRMLRALLEGSAPQDILAITFTKKAAGEMRQRLQEWLLEFSTASDEDLAQALRVRGLLQEPTPAQLHTLRTLHESLLRSGRAVQIRTFHSWFAALLRSAPLGVLQDLGLPTEYELLENDAKATALVWRRFQTRVAQDAAARQDYMEAVATHGRFQTQKALESALAKRVEFALADSHGVVDASVAHFTQQFVEFAAFGNPRDFLYGPLALPMLQDAARTLGQSSLVTCTNAATALEMALTARNAPGVRDALLTQQASPRKFSEKLLGLDAVREAQALVMRVQEADDQHEAWQHQQRMARLTRGLLQDYAALKRERGWVDMADLERAALALMSDPVLSGWVQERLDARVRHLLIDEFQDTNPLQWQALSAWLAGYGGAGYAPSVFIVGDPKQSIYRFRRAEPQVFIAAKDFVVQALGGDVLMCDHTRRNANAIIETVNSVMGQAQEAGEFADYRPHTTASQETGQLFKLPPIAREAKEATPSAEPQAEWRDSLTTARHELEETRHTLECRQAAQWLAAQLHAPGATLQARDVMVLSRKRDRLGLMQAELAALHIPTEQPEKTDLGDSPEVQDLVALLDVLVSPLHNLSLARVLKSPLFSWSDDALVELALKVRSYKGSVAPQREEGFEEGVVKDPSSVSWLQVLQSVAFSEPLAQAGRTLTQWQQWVRSLPPHDALAAVYHHGNVLERYAAAAPAEQRDATLANLRALLGAALSLDGGRYSTAYALVRALRAGGIAAPVRSDANAVRLLTVHGAKGLEASLVLLLDTDAKTPNAETMGVLVDWPGQDAYPQSFVFLASEARPPASVADALKAEQAERRREELNTLYVALTRARHTLVLSSTQPRTVNASSWWQRVLPHAQEQAIPAPAVGTPAANPPASFTLNVLPNVPQALVEYAQTATKVIATTNADATSPDSPDSLESRKGQAMHRLLEWVVPAAQGVAVPHWSAAQLAAVEREFALDAAQLEAAGQMARTIVQGQGAWAWDASQLAWHSNEVALTLDGRTLRIDRLVQQRATSHWWVLDYKSAAQPQAQAELRAQLLAYQQAVAQSYPGQTVRAAFLTARGTLIELE